jgi:hypothetical protein
VLNQFQIGTALLAGAITEARKTSLRRAGYTGIAADSKLPRPVRGAFIESAGRPVFFNAADGPERALREAFTDTDQEDCK